MLYLSKPKYCSAVQCPKILWLKEHKPDAFDESVTDQTTLDRGTAVGELARGLFGDHVTIPYGDISQMIQKTREMIEAGTPVIAEASFSYEGLFCSVDILRVLGNDRVELIEVKSSTQVKDIYVHDIAYQYYVLTKLGYNVQRASIARINSAYVRRGKLEIDKLFAVEDLTEQAIKMQPEVEKRVAELAEYLKRETEPERAIGGQCFSPYTCGFFKYCTRDLPKPNIFDVGGVQTRTKLANLDKGIVSFRDIEQKKALKPDKMMQISHELYDLPPAIDRDSIKQFLDGLSYPLYFLDFESIQPAIPLFDDSSPYEQVVFQYSLHYIERAGGELKHKEYLARPGADPRRALAERLCGDIPKDACTLAYNMAFEKTRIRGLAEMYPDLAEHLMNIHDRIADLMVPFQKRWYYTKAMQGSYSIKYVLPALFPDDPELDYHNLQDVHNGTEASAAFENMDKMEPEEREKYRTNLLKYCALDTFAMVKVWEKLTESVKH